MKHLQDILTEAGVSNRMVDAIIYGKFGKVEADTEFGQEAGGISSYREEYQEKTVREIAENWDGRIECGLKYPSFDYKKFAKKFNAVVIGEVSEEHHFTITYTAVKTDVGIFTFGNFEKDNEHFSYTGVVFNNEDSAFLFMEWFLSSPANYVKDIELGQNSLGGFNRSQVDKYLKGV